MFYIIIFKIYLFKNYVGRLYYNLQVVYVPTLVYIIVYILHYTSSS